MMLASVVLALIGGILLLLPTFLARSEGLRSHRGLIERGVGLGLILASAGLILHLSGSGSGVQPPSEGGPKGVLDRESEGVQKGGQKGGLGRESEDDPKGVLDRKREGNRAEGPENRLEPAQTADDPAGERLPRMIQFTSKTCPVCRQMKPLIDALSQECNGRGVDLLSVDIDDPAQRKLVRQSRLAGVPTYLFVDRNGNEAARLIGLQTEGTLKQALSVLRGETCPGVSRLPTLEEIRSKENEGEPGCETKPASPNHASTECSSPHP